MATALEYGSKPAVALFRGALRQSVIADDRLETILSQCYVSGYPGMRRDYSGDWDAGNLGVSYLASCLTNVLFIATDSVLAVQAWLNHNTMPLIHVLSVDNYARCMYYSTNTA